MDEKNKILILLTNSFVNDSRVLKEGTSLVNAGYDVTLACFFAKKLPRQEVVNGIKVNRFDFLNNMEDLSQTNSDYKKVNTKTLFWPKLKRLIKLFLPQILLTPLTKFKTFCYYIKLTFKLYNKYSKATDIVHCNDLNTLPIGVIFKIFTLGRIKIVYDAHEYETEVGFSVVGFKKICYQITERICIKFADKIITVSNGIANEYTRLYKIEKPTVLFNAPLLKEPKKLDIFRKELGIRKDQMIFIYQGGVMRNRGIEVIIETFEKLQSNNKAVIFLGYGELDEFIKAKAKEQPNIYFYPAVNQSVLLDYSASADIGLALINNSCLSYYYCLPNKLFEYTMAKIPTIASNLFELSKFIKTNGNGILLKEYSAQGLKEVIEKITPENIAQMKRRAEKTREKYNWQNEEKKLVALYDDLKIRKDS